MVDKKFSILITTKNRKSELAFTLNELMYLLKRDDVECIICDDGSNDDTFEYVKAQHPYIQVFRNNESKGLIYSRNKLLEKTKATYAISLDDDLHFITKQPLEQIESFFNQHPKCAVMSFRIFWGIEMPSSTAHHRKIEQVKSFAGGAHVWRMEDWRALPNYPEWFVFYGEEVYAGFNLFKANRHIYYYPDILCHHRVNMNKRKKDNDYLIRQRRSLRAGWYLYFLFYPWVHIPRKFAYSVWMQLKTKVFKGDLKMLIAIFQAFGDVILNASKLSKNSNRLSLKEFQDYNKLQDVKLYWSPVNDNMRKPL